MFDYIRGDILISGVAKTETRRWSSRGGGEVVGREGHTLAWHEVFGLDDHPDRVENDPSRT